MPIYEYQCQQCQHQFDVLQKISDPRLTKCPHCHQNSLQKLMSAVGFQLKGGGWYETDFKDKAKPASADSSDGAKAEIKTEVKAEVKAEVKTK